VRDEEHHRPLLAPDRHQLDLHQLAGLGVEAGEGLVHQQDLGLDRQRPGERHPLAHAARELPG
jgi:hypothetical protein